MRFLPHHIDKEEGQAEEGRREKNPRLYPSLFRQVHAPNALRS